MSTSDAAATPTTPPDTGETLARLLIQQGLLTEKQLKHAQRVRSKLAHPKTLLNTMLELEFFSTQQFNETLRSANLDIRIGDLLVELGDISAKELETAVRLQQQPRISRQKLGEILIEQRFIKESRLIDVLANQFGFVNVEPDFSLLDKTLLVGITGLQCEQFGFLPLRREGDIVLVACTDPKNPEITEAAERLLKAKVRPAICSRHALNVAINKFKTLTGGKAPAPSAADDSKIARLVDEVLQAAIRLGTSDVHCEPMADKLRVRFRRDGVLWHFKDYPIDVAQAVIARLKVLSKANIAERRRHQDGKIEYTSPDSGQIVDIRCSFYVSVHGEKACLRLLNRKATLLNIEEIDMAPAVLDRFKYEALDVPTGVVLITGPTGSGKTTTLYGCVDYLNDDETSIITAEEPVEYVIEGITQCSLNPKIEMTFAETLRHMVRQDPDVIVLGEVRDRESAEAAIQSALTGHKVLTTFHTEDTIGALLRLMNMDIEEFLISSTVVAVLAQRLLRRVCQSCAQPYRPTPLEMQRIGLGADDLRLAKFIHGTGCEACQYTGHRGRISVFELLIIDDQIRDAILTRKPAYDIRRIAVESAGLISLMEDGLEKAARGQTSLSEVMRVLPRLYKPRSLAEIRRLCRSTNG